MVVLRHFSSVIYLGMSLHSFVYLHIRTCINAVCIHLLAGIVGEVEDAQDGKEYFLWTHRRLDIGWNRNQVRHAVAVTVPTV